MKTEHRYAQVLRWIADGFASRIEARLGGSEHSGQWGALIGQFKEWGYSDDWQAALLRGDFDGNEWEFRIKPRTVKIGNREIEAPVLEPVEGQTVWYWDSVHWKPVTSGGSQEDWARDGWYFASPEACRAAREAWVALMRGEA